MFTVSNEKFWFARTECGYVVGSGDHELTRDNLSRDTAALVAAAPDLLAALQLVYANAGESPEWIRSRIAPVIARATGAQ